MRLWRISQNVNDNYDTFDSAIIAAGAAAEALNIHPNGACRWVDGRWRYADGRADRGETWAHVNDVCVELIGEALPDTEQGVILASFNAG